MNKIGRHFGSFDRVVLPVLLYIGVGYGIWVWKENPWWVLAVVGGLMFIDLTLHVQYLMRRGRWY